MGNGIGREIQHHEHKKTKRHHKGKHGGAEPAPDAPKISIFEKFKAMGNDMGNNANKSMLDVDSKVKALQAEAEAKLIAAKNALGANVAATVSEKIKLFEGNVLPNKVVPAPVAPAAAVVAPAVAKVGGRKKRMGTKRMGTKRMGTKRMGTKHIRTTKKRRGTNKKKVRFSRKHL